MDIVDDSILMHRGEARDLVRLRLPPVSYRIELQMARRVAAGFTPADDEAKRTTPSESAIVGDLQAVGMAALGMSLVGGLPQEIPVTYRQCRRDVCVYGDAVLTALWGMGYTDISHLADVGIAIMTWIDASLDAREAAVGEALRSFP